MRLYLVLHLAALVVVVWRFREITRPIGEDWLEPLLWVDGLVKYLDDGLQTHSLWTFFAPDGEACAR